MAARGRSDGDAVTARERTALLGVALDLETIRTLLASKRLSPATVGLANEILERAIKSLEELIAR